MDFITKQIRYTILVICMSISFTSYSQEPIQRAFEESYVLENQGQYLPAANKLRLVYQADSYETNLRMGWLYYQGGNMAESITHYGRAIALKPYALESRFGIVLPFAANGRWDDVVAQYTKILEIDPQNSVANYRIGLIFYNRAQYERAEVHLEKAVNLYPFDYDSLLLFGWIKFQLGKTREAKVLFGKVLLHTPGDASALEGLSLIK
jgi:tetratricopeptide (TPR) repeat protein